MNKTENKTIVCKGCNCVKEYRDSKWFINNYCNTCGKKLEWRKDNE